MVKTMHGVIVDRRRYEGDGVDGGSHDGIRLTGEGGGTVPGQTSAPGGVHHMLAVDAEHEHSSILEGIHNRD